MKENALERRFFRAVKLLGGRAIKIAPLDKGVPDRLVLWPGGRMELVELKTDVGKLSPMQVVWHARAAHIEHYVTVLYGPDQMDTWLEERKVELCL